MKLKDTYYLDGYAVRWRGESLGDDGVMMKFACIDEDGNVAAKFSVAVEKLRRREDITVAAKEALGLFRAAASGDDAEPADAASAASAGDA